MRSCTCAGAGLSVNSDARGTVPHAQAGKALLIIGLAALVGIICFFMATVIYAHRSPHLQVRAFAQMNCWSLRE